MRETFIREHPNLQNSNFFGIVTIRAERELSLVRQENSSANWRENNVLLYRDSDINALRNCLMQKTQTFILTSKIKMDQSLQTRYLKKRMTPPHNRRGLGHEMCCIVFVNQTSTRSFWGGFRLESLEMAQIRKGIFTFRGAGRWPRCRRPSPPHRTRNPSPPRPPPP